MELTLTDYERKVFLDAVHTVGDSGPEERMCLENMIEVVSDSQDIDIADGDLVFMSLLAELNSGRPLQLNDVEAALAKTILEENGMLIGDYTGSYGPNVEQWGESLEELDLEEATCFSIADRIS